MLSPQLLSKLSTLLLNAPDQFTTSAPASPTGLSNTNTVLTSPNRKSIFRQYNAGNLPWGYHCNEVRLLKFLHKAQPGTAPQLLYFDFSRGDHPEPFAVISFVEGSAVAPGSLRKDLEGIVLSLRKIHAIPLPPETPEPSGVVLEKVEDLENPSLGPVLPSISLGDKKLIDEKIKENIVISAEKLAKSEKFGALGQAILELWGKVKEVSGKHSDLFQGVPRTALVHGDAHCGNILKDGEKFTWIDWEAAHRGHPYEDLASLVVVAFPPFSKEEEGECMRLYGEEKVDEVLFGLYKMRKMVRVVFALVEMVAAQGEGVSPQISGGLQFFVNICTALTTQLLN